MRQKKEFSINADRIVFQQKVLNSRSNLESCARVIIRTDNANKGDFPKLNELNMTTGELSELNSSYKQEILSEWK